MNRTLENQDIVVLDSDWDDHWGTIKQVMVRLAEHNRVIYVESFLSPLRLLKQPVKVIKKLARCGGLKKYKENFFIMTSGFVLPFGKRLSFVSLINRKLKALQVRRALKKLGFKNPILWISRPRDIDFIGALDEKMLVYHCVDEMAEYGATLAEREKIRDLEQKIMRKADIVFVTSKALFDAKKRFNKNTYLVPNAADVEHFMKANDKSTLIPQVLEKIPQPIVGYVGMLGDAFDVEAVRYIAQRHPEWSIVLIGGILQDEINLSPINNLKNIHFLGMQKIEDLPAYMKGFSVSIIPFLVNELTRNVYPLKLHEYMAVGKPIVSTHMPELYPFKEVVRISRNHEQFENDISLAIKEDNKDLTARRIEIAKQNTWTERVNRTSQVIADYLNKGQNE
ncbi:MAG: glycosyltransferase [Candidatus Omnitrophota bacterium]